jgi:hypothetical protein
MDVQDEHEEWLGPDVSVYGAGAVDPNLEDVKGNFVSKSKKNRSN